MINVEKHKNFDLLFTVFTIDHSKSTLVCFTYLNNFLYLKVLDFVSEWPTSRLEKKTHLNI